MCNETILLNEHYQLKIKTSHCSCLICRIDAKNTISERLGGLVNDAEEGTDKCNSKMKLMVINSYPRLCLFAKREIKAGEEVRYDYGENTKKLPWVILMYICYTTCGSCLGKISMV